MKVNKSFGDNLRSKYQSGLISKIYPYVILSLLFIILIVPLILKPEIDIYDERDEKCCHYPVIVDFSKHFPNINFDHYPSTTTPLYHILLSIPARLFGPDIIRLRFNSSLFSLMCLFLIYKYFSKRGDRINALLFTFIFMFSPYFIGPAIRISTDNAAFLFAILTFYTMDFGLPKNKYFILTNIFILITVLIRQLYAWFIGVFILLNLVKNRLKTQVINPIYFFLPTLIPIAGLAYFIFLWKGLTPPSTTGAFVAPAPGLNWDVPVYIISLLGLYGVLFSLLLFKINKWDKKQFLYLALLTGLAFGYLLIHPVNNEYFPLLGWRGGALWLIVSKFPNFLSSSIVFWGLFPVGLVCLYIMMRYLVSRHEYLMVISFVLWQAANMINLRTYQKYYEPFILFFMGYVFVTVKTKGDIKSWIGPVILLLGMIGVAVTRFFL